MFAELWHHDRKPGTNLLSGPKTEVDFKFLELCVERLSAIGVWTQKMCACCNKTGRDEGTTYLLYAFVYPKIVSSKS